MTGASQGIGKAIAEQLARDGARVLLLDIQMEKLKDVAAGIRKDGGQADIYQANVSSFKEAHDAVDKMIDQHEHIDHLVNNAGITRDSLLMRMNEKDWDAVISVNLKGIFNLCKAVVRPMMSRRYGRIVNISSVVGLMGNAGQTNYSAAKAGVIGFTKSLAREVASRGITVNAVAPGYIQTSMTENLPEKAKDVFMSLIPLRRFGTPEEVAYAVKFFLAEEAAYLTGCALGVNGGMYM